jgi:hypothetical protein
MDFSTRSFVHTVLDILFSDFTTKTAYRDHLPDDIGVFLQFLTPYGDFITIKSYN